METIKFSRKSFWYKYWKFVSNAGYLDDEPKDTCSLRKQLIVYTFLALFILPFFIILKSLQLVSVWKNNLTDKLYILLGALVNCLIISVSIVTVAKYSISWLIGYLISACFILGGLLLIVGLVFIIVFSVSKYKEYRENLPNYNRFKTKRPNIIIVLYNSLKDKLCSKIEYVE